MTKFRSQEGTEHSRAGFSFLAPPPSTLMTGHLGYPRPVQEQEVEFTEVWSQVPDRALSLRMKVLRQGNWLGGSCRQKR